MAVKFSSFLFPTRDFFTSLLIERTGYKAQQTSKGQTNRPRFMSEGPQPCTSFVLHELCNHKFSVGQLHEYRNHLLYFVRFCAGSTPNIANKNIQ